MPKKNLYRLVILLSTLAYSWIIYNLFFQDSEGGITICWFKTISGLPCPACGSTSGMIEIFKGNFYAAFYHNPFSYASLVILSIASFWVIFDLLRGKSGFHQFYLRTNEQMKKKRIIIPIILLFLIIWAWNIYKAFNS